MGTQVLPNPEPSGGFLYLIKVYVGNWQEHGLLHAGHFSYRTTALQCHSMQLSACGAFLQCRMEWRVHGSCRLLCNCMQYPSAVMLAGRHEGHPAPPAIAAAAGEQQDSRLHGYAGETAVVTVAFWLPTC